MFVGAFIAVGSDMARNPQAWGANAESPVSNILRRYGASSVDHLPSITTDQPREPPEP
jgi:hypothetical protein